MGIGRAGESANANPRMRSRFSCGCGFLQARNRPLLSHHMGWLGWRASLIECGQFRHLTIGERDAQIVAMEIPVSGGLHRIPKFATKPPCLVRGDTTRHRLNRRLVRKLEPAIRPPANSPSDGVAQKRATDSAVVPEPNCCRRAPLLWLHCSCDAFYTPSRIDQIRGLGRAGHHGRARGQGPKRQRTERQNTCPHAQDHFRHPP